MTFEANRLSKKPLRRVHEIDIADHDLLIADAEP
jgi:hypothetical protein